MPTRNKRALAIVALLCAVVWLSGGLWRLGEDYWNFRLLVNPFGDEGLEWVYSRIGDSGGKPALAYLVREFDREVVQGGNDVVLSGIIAGIIATGRDDASRFLIEVFGRHSSPDQLAERYISILAARGLQEIYPDRFTTMIPKSSPYLPFAIGTSSATPNELRDGAERFDRLEDEIEKLSSSMGAGGP